MKERGWEGPKPMYGTGKHRQRNSKMIQHTILYFVLFILNTRVAFIINIAVGFHMAFSKYKC